MLRCPNCNSIDVGKISDKQFYCWNCFIEVTAYKDKLEIFQVEADGSLSSLDDLFKKEVLEQSWV